MSHYQRAYFLLSVAEVKQLPADIGNEVAIVGRSNAGKSSVLNALTHNKRLARVSKTPGRTQQINIFVLDEKRRIADLPGYGFAKAPEAVRAKWQRLVDAYLKKRDCLQGLVLVMDIRHPLKPLDWVLLEYCQELNLPVHILLNKLDKLSKAVVQKTEIMVKRALTEHKISATLQGFSAVKGSGIQTLEQVLDGWFHFAK